MKYKRIITTDVATNEPLIETKGLRKQIKEPPSCWTVSNHKQFAYGRLLSSLNSRVLNGDKEQIHFRLTLSTQSKIVIYIYPWKSKRIF